MKKEEVKSGLIIPESAKITSKCYEGVVMGVGLGTKEDPMEVSEGDVIMYKKEVYPTSDGCDVIDMKDVWYVTGLFISLHNQYAHNDPLQP